MSCVLSWTNADGSVDVVTLDVYDAETHGMPTEVTDFPVEDGPNVSDNIRRKPKTLTIEGYVSDTPLPSNQSARHPASLDAHQLDVPKPASFTHNLQALDVPSSPLKPNLASLASAGFNALAGALGFSNTPQVNARKQDAPGRETITAQIWTWPGWASRVQDTFNLLEKARDNAVLMRVVTDLKTYTGMAFTDNGLQVPRKTEDGNGAPFMLDLKQIRVVNSQTVTAPKPAEPSGQLKKSAGSKALKDGLAEAKKKRDTVLAALLGLAKVHGLH
jgi:hypothetical protein